MLTENAQWRTSSREAGFKITYFHSKKTWFFLYVYKYLYNTFEKSFITIYFHTWGDKKGKNMYMKMGQFVFVVGLRFCFFHTVCKSGYFWTKFYWSIRNIYKFSHDFFYMKLGHIIFVLNNRLQGARPPEIRTQMLTCVNRIYKLIKFFIWHP